jgi:tRNA A37 N6-isopentenylltransferase MiaA
MMAAGFLNEVKELHQRGDLTARHPSMRSVGYRQLWAHLDGEYVWRRPNNAAFSQRASSRSGN